MIGSLWFALLAFILGAGLTYLRMAGSATRQIAKPVPRRLVMGGIIPGVIDPPVPLPVDVGPEWKIRAGAAPSAETGPSVGASDAPAPVAELAENTKPIADAVAEDAAAVVEQAAPEVAATPEEVSEPPVVQRLEPPWPIEPEVAATPEEVSEPPVIQRLEPPWPIEPEAPVAEEPDVAAPLEDQSAAPSEAQPHAATEPEGPMARRIAAGATDEPSTSSWWAAAFDRGDPGPYPGPLRYSSAWPPAGSRVLEVDDEFAAALGAGAAASAASAALFGAAHRYAPEPEPVRPERDGRTQGTAPTPPVVDDAPREMAPTLSSPPTAPSDIAEALADTADELIKGNRDSMLYHTPDSPWYARTTAEEWFHTEQEAQAAGFQRWNSRVNK